MPALCQPLPQACVSQQGTVRFQRHIRLFHSRMCAAGRTAPELRLVALADKAAAARARRVLFLQHRPEANTEQVALHTWMTAARV